MKSAMRISGSRSGRSVDRGLLIVLEERISIAQNAPKASPDPHTHTTHRASPSL
jgi:hypothetical protein